MIISMIAGIISNTTEEKEEQKLSFSTISPTKNTPETSVVSGDLNNEQACNNSCGCESSEKKKFSFSSAMKYAFVTLLGDIASPLLLGLIIGALITVAIPSNLSDILIEYSWISYIVVIAMAVPMYVCATASLPIAAGLMLAGVSPGAAFVFLSAGPATNTVTIGVVKKMLGTRTLYIYLATIIIGSVIFGFGLDYILKDVSIKEMIHMNEEAGFIEWASTGILWIMVMYFIIKPYFIKEASCCADSSCVS